MRFTVYTITTIDQGRVVYVGETNNFQRRKREHLTLNTGTKEWLAEIGTGNVLIEPVAEFNNEVDALKYEDELILKYNTINRGYNKHRSGLIKAEDPKEYQREYQRTDKRKEYQREYQREWQREYEKTDKRKEYKREYRQTDKYREYQREYRQTDKHREYHREYYHAKKLGMSVAEYRQYIGE